MSDFKNKNNVKKGSVLSKISFLLSIAAGVVLLVFLVVLYAADNIEVSQSRNDSRFVVLKDYICSEVEDADTPIGVKKEYANVNIKM